MGGSVTTSSGEESGSWGGMIEGITWSRTPISSSALVTGANSMATVTTTGVAAVPSVSLWVTTTSPPASASCSFLVVTSGGRGVVGAGVVGGREVAG